MAVPVVVIFFRKKSFQTGHLFAQLIAQTTFRATKCSNTTHGRHRTLRLVFIGLLLLCGGAHEASDHQTVRNRLSNRTQHIIVSLGCHMIAHIACLILLRLSLLTIFLLSFFHHCVYLRFSSEPRAGAWITASSFSVI